MIELFHADKKNRPKKSTIGLDGVDYIQQHKPLYPVIIITTSSSRKWRQASLLRYQQNPKPKSVRHHLKNLYLPLNVTLLFMLK